MAFEAVASLILLLDLLKFGKLPSFSYKLEALRPSLTMLPAIPSNTFFTKGSINEATSPATFITKGAHSYGSVQNQFQNPGPFGVVFCAEL
jgi:hypothetical protein